MAVEKLCKHTHCVKYSMKTYIIIYHYLTSENIRNCVLANLLC